MRASLRAVSLWLALLTSLGCESLVTDPAAWGTVRVSVRTPGGQPISGLQAELYAWSHPLGYAATDDSGRITFARIPRGNYGVMIRLTPAYLDLSEIFSVPPAIYQDDIVVSAGSDTTINFTFAARSPGSIEAEVRDQRGAPIPGLRVYFYNTFSVVGYRITNAAGIARADSVPFGGYGAYLLPPDSLGVSGAPAIFRDGFTVFGEVVPRIPFVVTTCFGNITVDVRDDADQPVPSATVVAYTFAAERGRGTTDIQGRIAFTRTPCGDYGVMAFPPAGYTVTMVQGRGYRDGLTLSEGSSVAVTLRLERVP